VSTVPVTDPRRAKALREALGQMAPWLAPEWAGLGQSGDFGAALYEIAARLAEHSTRRLDQTALRDELAFLDTLDIAAPAPSSASVPIVFMLAEKRSEPVYAPQRVQVAAAGDDQPIMFETREAIMITPARPLRLVAADPGADRIELAPPEVIAPPRLSPPPVTYRLVSAAEPAGVMLQLAQAVGLGEGDLLRIAGTVYRIAKRSGEIVTLLDPLEAAVPAGAAIEKVTRLDSFALRNLSDHVFYVGHKELLKLDGEATIALRLDPPSLARRLAQLDIAYDLWGKKTGEDSAAWHALRLLGSSEGELALSKDWPGAVEEVEAEGRKSRWIRLRLQTAISDSARPDTRAVSIGLKVNSNAPAVPQTTEGSSSIVSAFHNGLPLPLTTSFLPFGPEPQRFDTFAIAVPEALSKKGAEVELAVALSDASLGALAAVTFAPERIYGIGRNGRLQAIRFDSTGVARWRQLDRPPPASTAGGGAAPRLDRSAGLYAYQLQAGSPTTDILVARDQSKAIWIASLSAEGQDWPVAKWALVPPPTAGEPPDSVCLVFTAVQSAPVSAPVPGTSPAEPVPASGPPMPPLTQMVAAGPAGLHVQTIDATGGAAGWHKLTSSPDALAPKAPLRLAPVAGGDGLIVAIDSAGAVWRGTVKGEAIAWAQLEPDLTAADIQPAAVLQDDKLHVVVATRSETEPVAMILEGEDLLYPPEREREQAGQPISFSSVAAPKGSGFPFVAMLGADKLGAGGILLWSGEKQASAAAVPVEGEASKFSLLLAPIDSAGALRLLLGSPDERLLHSEVGSGKDSLPFVARDAIRAGDSSPKYYWVKGDVAPVALVADPVTFTDYVRFPITPDLIKTNKYYRLLSSVSGGSGKATAVSGNQWQLVLDPADFSTDVGDFLKIGASFFEIESIDTPDETDESDDESTEEFDDEPDEETDEESDEESGDESDEEPDEETDDESRIATLKTAAPKGTLVYSAYRAGDSRQFRTQDKRTLLSFDGSPLPEDVKVLEFKSPASPAIQACTFPKSQPAGESWVGVATWTTEPKDGEASFDKPRSPGPWTQVPLPRSTENPDLAWEYFDGRGWRRLDRHFSDGTANLASSGSIGFWVPDDLSPTDVAGKQDYWIRARLVGGDYGRPAYIVETNGNRQSITVDRSTLNPPEIFSIEASYALRAWAAPEIVLAVNNLATVDQTQAAASAGAEFDLFEGLAAHTGDPAGLGRSIYLGLTRPPGVDALSLYVDAPDMDAPSLRLKAEVLRPEGWAPIVCKDETAGLARPGLIRLFLSTEPAQLPLFGCSAWWLRLRPEEPKSDWAPVVRGLYLNAVMAEQAKSLRQEILGSSLGAPDQSYTLAEAPVLPETLELRVRESLSDEEKAELVSDDPEAVASYDDIDGEWIRWRETDSFVEKGGAARLFRLDPSGGEIRFGNGRDGRIPPAGRDSIRAIFYQAVGGSRGNVPAFAVDQLKTALESVELAVNPVEAGGGADAPPDERLAETAPARLRHATRALAPPDVEALATGSSPDVVRARCLRRNCCGFDLVVAIRQAGERCPVPSRARREGIARNIADAGWGALTPESIRVLPPSYVHVRVEAVVVALSAESVAQVEKDVREAVAAFLHATDGGPEGLGWPFGRRPWPSDVQRVAASVAGVDRVVHAVIAARDSGADLDRLGPDALICVEEDDIDLLVQPPRSGG